MPYNTKTVKRDGSGTTPPPQHFNPDADDYEPIYGRYNASRVELYGPTGQPISTAEGKLAVQASDLETLVGALAAAAVTDPTASASTIALLKGLMTILGGISASPTANTVLGRLKDLATILGEVQASPTANTALDRLKVIKDALTNLDSTITDLDGNLVSRLGIVGDIPGDYTVLARIKALETILTAIRDSAGIKKIIDTVNVQLTSRSVAAEHTFHNAATATGEGTHLSLAGQDKVIISISGTSTSRTISFKATGPNSVVGYVLGSKISAAGSVVVLSGTTGTGEVWEIDGLAGYTDFFCSLDVVGGGNVTVKGKLVA